MKPRIILIAGQIISVIVIGILYLAISFDQLSISPSGWNHEARSLFSFVSFGAYIGGTFFSILEFQDKLKK